MQNRESTASQQRGASVSDKTQSDSSKVKIVNFRLDYWFLVLHFGLT